MMVCGLLTHDSGERRILTQESMTVDLPRNEGKKAATAFTLLDVLLSFLVVGLVMGGVAYGYVQADRMAEFSSLSMAAQSYALQGIEQLRAAKWDTQLNVTNTGYGMPDETGPTNFMVQVDTLDVPVSGVPVYGTNFVTVQTLSQSPNYALRQYTCSCVWQFPPTGQYFTNTVITLRAPDE
jgi:type II secretory pathway pseudopilin PulG